MKLTREDLIHAKDVQLAAVGITRRGNAGWMCAALDRYFSDEEIAAFRAATAPPKIIEHGRPFCGKRRLQKAAAGTLDLFTAAKQQPFESPENYANAIFEKNRSEFTT